MPRIRMEQLQSLTLTNESISDGKLYDANGIVKSDFDPSRLIDQNKIKDIEYNPSGWISKGIINKVEMLPVWEAGNEGRLFYVNSSDQLYLGIGTEPWYILISGDTETGWDAELTVRTGLDGLDWNGTMATNFKTTSYSFSPDGSDLFVYMNGSLQRLDHDYEIVDNSSIRMTRNVTASDTVTILVHLSASMLNYATKSWVFDQIQSGGVNHSLDAAYDDGSIISVDNRDVDYRLSTDTKFVISEAATSVPLPATQTGTVDLSSGHDWQAKWQSFDIVYRNGGTTVGPSRVYLNTPTVSVGEVATEISEGLVEAGMGELFGFVDNMNIGIQSTAIGSDISFDISAGTNLLPVTGHIAGAFTGSDATSSSHNFGINAIPSADSGLADNETFWFSVNGTEYNITTGVDTTIDQLSSLVDVTIDSDFSSITESNDIIVKSNVPGLAFPTLVENVASNGQIEITQVTTVDDVNRSLSSKYFTLDSIDNAIFGSDKEYYTWYHLDAEKESTVITTTSEDSNVTLADKYIQLQSPSDDYFVWFEVETPQTSGYQGLGLTGISTTTSTGLLADQTYDFKLSVDGSESQELSITTSPNITPISDAVEVTLVDDVNQSLSGKHFIIDSTNGNSYYPWYNIDMPIASEVISLTSVADSSQSLSGKSFTIFTPSQQYYTWLSMMTDAGLPAVKDINTIAIEADISQSLSGKSFNIDSADGSQYYVWYNMMIDAGIETTPETSTIVTTADSGNSLSSRHFEFSSTLTNYYAWYRMRTEDPIIGEAEVTNVIIPSDVSKSLSGKSWNFNTPYNDYYVWYSMEETPLVPATPEESTFTFNSVTASDYTSEYIRLYNFNDAYDVLAYDGFTSEFESTDDGWAANGVTSTLYSIAGIATMESASTDPGIIKTVNMDGGLNRYITARIKRTAGVAGVISLYFATGSHTFSGSFVNTIDEPTYDGSGWATVEFDMHNLTFGADDWKDNTITQVRLDLGHTADCVFEIDYIKATPNLDGYSNPILLLVDSADTATEIAENAKDAINAAGVPFVATSTDENLVVTCNNNGEQISGPEGSTNITALITVPGTDMTAATFSVNPSPAEKTGVQINITENDGNSTVAAATNAQLTLLSDITTEINGATITITNVDNGSVENALDVDSNAVPSVTTEGVTSSPAQYSTDPNIVGRTGIVVDILQNDDADTIASKTATKIDNIIHFDSIATGDEVEIATVVGGESLAPIAEGTSGFIVVVDVPGVNYVAPTFSTDPAPEAKSPIKVDINEDDTDIVIAEATTNAIDSQMSFTATRVNEVITITDQTFGPVDGIADVDTSFVTGNVQEGQDYAAPTFTADPMGTGVGIKIDIDENDTSIAVAKSLENGLNSIDGITVGRTGDVLTITIDDSGVINDATDIDSGFIITTTTQGYEAYSSNDPTLVGKTGLKININVNDDAETIAAKTQTVVNNVLYFAAGASGDKISITGDTSGNLLSYDAGDSGFTIVTSSSDMLADVSWGNILTLLNKSTISNATWAFSSGDVRIVSNTNGSWTQAELFSGDGQDLLTNISGFTSLNTVTYGSSTYSVQPAGTGNPIKAQILVGANASLVANATVNSIDAVTGFEASIDGDNVLTVTNTDFGVVSDMSDNGTQFTLDVTNQSANESTDPSIAGKTGIRVDINKNDDANTIATATQAAVDIGGEFYVTRLNNILSIQNDFAGSVTDTADIDTGFVFTKTGTGEDVKQSLFGENGLNITLPAVIDGVAAKPADTGVGTESLLGGENFNNFPKDFAVDINSEPTSEIFLNGACYNSSEIVSHINTKIAEAGVTNLEAYQITGQIGFRTIQLGSSQTLEIKDSLSDALATLGLSVGTYTGDFGEADSILEIAALDGNNLLTVDADIVPAKHGEYSIGSEGNRFKEIWAKEGYFDEGTIYLGTNKISINENKFEFVVDDGVNQYDYFGNTDPSIAPVGTEKIGVQGITGITPEKENALAGDDGTLQEMLVGISKAISSGKLFPNMNGIASNYGDPTDLKGFLNEKSNGLYFRTNEIVMVESINREIRILRQGTGVIEGTDWMFRDDAADAVGGRSVKYDLTELDENKEPTTGVLADDSFHIKTTGGIKLETGVSSLVHVTNDLRIDGDLIVDGDTVTLNTSTLDVEDNIVTLNKGVEGVPAIDAGIEIDRGSSLNSIVIWDETDDLFRAGLVGAEKAIATRADDMTDKGLVVWDNETASIKTTNTVTSDILPDMTGATGDVSTRNLGSPTQRFDEVFVGGLYAPNANIDKIMGAGDSNTYMQFHAAGQWRVVTGDIERLEVNNTAMTSTVNFTAPKVYNAVWNDIADFIEVEDECVITPGKCYFINKDFKHGTTTEVAQKGVLGIASDTYGYGLGKDEDKHQLPVAVGGFVLAYIDGEVEPGDALTSSLNGNLIVMPLEDKKNYPERIVATYYKPQLEDEYHGLVVDGRHWVKVK